MIAAAAIGGEAFASERTDLAVIGRWAGGLRRGRWRHVDASREDPGSLDVPLGLMTHYLTGIVLTEAFVLVPWRRPAPTFAAAVALPASPCLCSRCSCCSHRSGTARQGSVRARRPGSRGSCSSGTPRLGRGSAWAWRSWWRAGADQGAGTMPRVPRPAKSRFEFYASRAASGSGGGRGSPAGGGLCSSRRRGCGRCSLESP